MLQAAGGGSGGGVSPAGGGSGGDVARSLAGQVKALRSRVEELLERARDAEVYDAARICGLGDRPVSRWFGWCS